MSIFDLPLILISSLLYPEKEITRIVSLKANKEKSPFISETVPFVVSLIIIVAPGSPLPSSSVILPLTWWS